MLQQQLQSKGRSHCTLRHILHYSWYNIFAPAGHGPSTFYEYVDLPIMNAVPTSLDTLQKAEVWLEKLVLETCKKSAT